MDRLAGWATNDRFYDDRGPRTDPEGVVKIGPTDGFYRMAFAARRGPQSISNVNRINWFEAYGAHCCRDLETVHSWLAHW